MDYSYVSYRESEMAAACLLLAMNMNCDGEWVRILHFIVMYHIYVIQLVCSSSGITRVTVALHYD